MWLQFPMAYLAPPEQVLIRHARGRDPAPSLRAPEMQNPELSCYWFYCPLRCVSCVKHRKLASTEQGALEWFMNHLMVSPKHPEIETPEDAARVMSLFLDKKDLVTRAPHQHSEPSRWQNLRLCDFPSTLVDEVMPGARNYVLSDPDVRDYIQRVARSESYEGNQNQVLDKFLQEVDATLPPRVPVSARSP